MQLVDLLVRVVDKKGDAAVDASKRGDLIAAFPSGHEWSPEELRFDDWRIIRTRVPQTFIDTAIHSVMDQQRVGMKRRREWSINLDRLPNPELYKGPRTRAIIDVDSDYLLRTTQKKIVL